jgi:hypothetical protein
MSGEFDKELREAFKLEDAGNPNGAILQDLILAKIKAKALTELHTRRSTDVKNSSPSSFENVPRFQSI